MDEVIAAFVASVFFSILFNVDKGSLLLGGLAGTIGWLGYKVALHQINDSVMAMFLASVLVALVAELSARIFKKPATVILVPGIVTLVPGALAYYTMLYFVEGNYEMGLAKGAETVFSAGAIATGLAVVTVLFRTVRIREGGRDA